jgi:hypothetical protein
MTKTPEYLVMAERCDQCLTTPRRIVPARRAAQIMRDCKETDTKFICHKTKDVACRGVHELTGGCLAYRLAIICGIPVREV